MASIESGREAHVAGRPAAPAAHRQSLLRMGAAGRLAAAACLAAAVWLLVAWAAA